VHLPHCVSLPNAWNQCSNSGCLDPGWLLRVGHHFQVWCWANFCLKISKHYQNLLIQSLEKKFLLPGFEWALVFTPQRNPVRLLWKKTLFLATSGSKIWKEARNMPFLEKKRVLLFPGNRVSLRGEPVLTLLSNILIYTFFF